jgi:hypothetical protein
MSLLPPTNGSGLVNASQTPFVSKSDFFLDSDPSRGIAGFGKTGLKPT